MSKPKKRSVAACVAEIKAINRTFRRRPNMPDAEAQPLMEQKDRLIDEMAGLCPHLKVFATLGARRPGLPSRPIRICSHCGFCETHPVSGRFQVLITRHESRQVLTVPAEDYVICQGWVLKKLGINL